MKIHTMPQRSPEWYAVRAGKITATSFDTMAAGKPASIETLCLRVAAEKVTGKSEENGYTNQAMLDGVAREDIARQSYESTAFVVVTQVGFLEANADIGVSPDGLVDDCGGCEIKCPKASTHLYYWTRFGRAWMDYRWQVQGALYVSGRKWWDFVSYHPDFPPEKQLLVERVLPDPEAFEKLAKGEAYCRERIAALVEAFSRNGVCNGQVS
jgi:hypothetical protein